MRFVWCFQFFLELRASWVYVYLTLIVLAYVHCVFHSLPKYVGFDFVCFSLGHLVKFVAMQLA